MTNSIEQLCAKQPIWLSSFVKYLNIFTHFISRVVKILNFNEVGFSFMTILFVDYEVFAYSKVSKIFTMFLL